MPFIQANVALEEFGGTMKTSTNLFGVWTPDEKKNMDLWKNIWATPHDCVCINDNLDNTPQSDREIERLEYLFQRKFPRPSFIEKQ